MNFYSMGLAYNTKIFKDNNTPSPASWSDMWNPKLAGHIALTDITQSTAKDVINKYATPSSFWRRNRSLRVLSATSGSRDEVTSSQIKRSGSDYVILCRSKKPIDPNPGKEILVDHSSASTRMHTALPLPSCEPMA